MEKKFSYKEAKAKGETLPQLKQLNQLFRDWHNEQSRRYETVREAVEAFMKQRGKLLPPEFEDFFEWFKNHAAETDSILSRKINPVDFENYHRWQKNVIDGNIENSQQPKITHRIRGIALLLAKDKIEPRIWQSKKELMNFAVNVFEISQGKNVYDYTGYKLEKLKKDYPHDYEIATELYKKLF
jgi:hypothetical protein